MDPIDHLLNSLPPKLQSPTGGQSQAPNPTEQESIDRLLQRLGEPKKQQVRDRLLQDLQDSSNPRASIPWVDNNEKITPNLLPREIAKSEQQVQDQDQVSQDQVSQDQVSQDQRKAQQLKALKEQRQQEVRSQATQWLKTLDPKSTEGLWFDEFACNYDSRLVAAIEYLEALQEVDRFLA